MFYEVLSDLDVSDLRDVHNIHDDLNGRVVRDVPGKQGLM
jgi:hypothetical protein